MKHRHAYAFALGMMSIMLAALPARAQDAGQIGLTTGYPGSIGVILHVTDRVAVRPDFRFSFADEGEDITETSATSYGFGIAGLVYLTKTDALRTYVVPRFGYTHTSSETTLVYSASSLSLIGIPGATTILPAPATYKTTLSSKSFSGAFGAQFSLHKRFAVFGEAGFGYSTSSIDLGLGDFAVPGLDDSGPKTWSTQTSVGVILYFKD